MLSLYIMLFSVSFLVICHILSCLWYLVTQLTDLPETWVTRQNLQDATVSELYVAAFYWTVMTLTTVGYGDIAPASTSERLLATAVMLSGVFFYSYTIGTITSLVSEASQSQAKKDTRLTLLMLFWRRRFDFFTL